MKLIKSKVLKIIAIVAIVAGILALAVWGILVLLKREKNYLNAFAGSIEDEIDYKFTAFEALETKSPTLYDTVDLHITLRALENQNITLRLDIIKDNFVVIGLNSKERDRVDEIVANLAGYRKTLGTIYDELKTISDKDVITAEDETKFTNLFVNNYVANYDLIISEKIKLLDLLNASLDRHGVKNTSYLNSLNSLSDFAINMIENIHNPHIEKYGKNEVSAGYTYELLEKVTIALIEVKNNSKNYTSASFASLIITLETETSKLKAKYDTFISAYNNLTELEIKTLSKNGVGFDYTITPATENLTTVVNFLKADGILHNAIKSGSDIRKGIDL